MGNANSTKQTPTQSEPSPEITVPKNPIMTDNLPLSLKKGFQELNPLQQQLIAQITKNLSELVIENFRSLVLLLSYLDYRNMEGNACGADSDVLSTLRGFDDLVHESELNLWLSQMIKKVYLFKGSLKKFRMTIFDLIQKKEAARNKKQQDFDEQSQTSNSDGETNQEDDEAARRKMAQSILEQSALLHDRTVIFSLAEGTRASIKSCMKNLDGIDEVDEIKMTRQLDTQAPSGAAGARAGVNGVNGVWNLGRNLRRLSKLLSFSG